MCQTQNQNQKTDNTRMKNYGNTTIAGYAVEANTNVVTLHKTQIVRFNPERITLNSGGWQTVTTKKRMNEVSQSFFLGFSVWQKKGEWFVDFKEETLPFVDGMTLTR